MISLFKLIVLFAVVIILLAAILSAVFWVFNKLGIDTRIFAIKSTPPTLEIRSQILERLKTVSQLHTAIALVQTIVTDSQGKRLLGMEIGSTGSPDSHTGHAQLASSPNMGHVCPEILSAHSKQSIILPSI